MTRQRSPVVTLDESYERCRQLNRRHGTTYYWSTMLLPRVKRHHVHALYAFCRYADDIVDEPRANGSTGPEETERALADFGQRFFADLERGRSDDPVLKAVVHTVRAFDIDPDCFRRFLRSMTMDLTVTRYESWKDLRVYMDGSAAVDRRDDAAHPRAAGPGRRPARPRPGRRLPAHQLPPGRGRGPGSRARLPTPGGPAPLRRRSEPAPGHAGVDRADALRDRPLPSPLRLRRHRHRACSRRSRPGASARHGCCTAASST